MDASFVMFLGKVAGVFLLLTVLSRISLGIARKLQLSKKTQNYLELVYLFFQLILTFFGGSFIIGLFCYFTSPLLMI